MDSGRCAEKFKFENPLFDLQNQLTALRSQVPGISIQGHLFFDHSALFPKGHSERVLHPGNIPAEYLRENCVQPNQAILDAWQILTDTLAERSPNQQRLRVKT